jgi:hypothetical protein
MPVYPSSVPESIVDYSDAIQCKLKLAGIHDCTGIMMITNGHSNTDAAALLKTKLNNVGQQGLHSSTLKILREETIQTNEMINYNHARYQQMMYEIGSDAEQETFAPNVALIHHIVSDVAINQQGCKPNCWVSKVTHKLIDAGINSIEDLECELDMKIINDTIGKHGKPKLNQVTIHGMNMILGTADFRRG